MSRIGNKAIAIPKGVDVKIADNTVYIKGPKGKLSRAFVPRTSAEVSEGSIVVSAHGKSRSDRAYHGLMRALLANMVHGVSKGFSKELEVIGIGYKAEVKGKKLVLNLGYSHPIHFPFPEGITIDIKQSPKSTIVEILGIDKEAVGQAAAVIRSYRSPDSYKGKGIRYKGETVRLKAGKQ
jgi:large subunit ribosomal protein L6